MIEALKVYLTIGMAWALFVSLFYWSKFKQKFEQADNPKAATIAYCMVLAHQTLHWPSFLINFIYRFLIQLPSVMLRSCMTIYKINRVYKKNNIKKRISYKTGQPYDKE